MTDRDAANFISEFIIATSTFNLRNELKYFHTIGKYSFHRLNPVLILVKEKWNPTKQFLVENLQFHNRENNYMESEWFEEFKLVVKQDIETEIHNLLFDKLT